MYRNINKFKCKTKNINNYLITKTNKTKWHIQLKGLYIFNFCFLVVDYLFDFFE